MGFDRFFGFDLDERKTLQRLLDEVAAGAALTPAQLAAIDAVADLPTADPEADNAIWNDNGVLKVSVGST